MKRLKIIYLFTSPNLNGSSVQNKVINQIKYLNKAGADCKGAFFSSEFSSNDSFNEFIEIIPVKKCLWKYFQKTGQQINLMRAVINYAKLNFNIIDLFYFRYPGASIQLFQFVRMYGSKTIFEHLSKELAELKLNAKENPFGLKPSRLLSWLEYSALPIWREKIFGKRIRKNAKLGICNSQEIADLQREVAGGKYNTIIGGDAVDAQKFILKNGLEFNNELNLIFLKGASSAAEYNAIDRIYKGIKSYSGDVKIMLFILGHNVEYEKSLFSSLALDENIVQFPGSLIGEDLNKFIDSMHLGVSQFGIHRKGLKSNSTIKSREYTARGLPFIYGHDDPDFGLESNYFALQFPGDDTDIDMEQVIEFAKRTLSDPLIPQKMRKYAEEHLDYEVKMKKLYQILLELKNE